MADTTPKMSLRRWDQLSDLFSHDQLSDNWAKLDFHDHTPGRGVQIPTEGIFDGAITAPKLASGLDPAPAYTSYKMVRSVLADFGQSLVAGTYLLAEYRPVSLLTGSATGYSGIWQFDPADFAVTSRSTVLRLRFTVAQFSTAPGITFTLGLYPVTSIAAGAATLGTVITGSTVAILANTINSTTSVVSADFAAPIAGNYIIAASTSGTSAASSAAQLRGDLQVRQV